MEKRTNAKRTTEIPPAPRFVYDMLDMPPPPPPLAGSSMLAHLKGTTAENAKYYKAMKNRPKSPGKHGEHGKETGLYTPWDDDQTQVIIDYLIKNDMHHGCWACISKELAKDPNKPARTGVQVKDRWRNLLLAAQRTDNLKMRNPVAPQTLMRVREIQQRCGTTTTPKKGGGKSKAAGAGAGDVPPAPPPE